MIKEVQGSLDVQTLRNRNYPLISTLTHNCTPPT